MSIATKNGSIIVKDGSIAENCGCCETGWYCCNSLCRQDMVQSVSVTLTMSDYLVWTKERYGQGPLYLHASIGCLGSAYAGTHTLERHSGAAGSGGAVTWRKVFPDVPNSSCKANIEFVMYSSYWQLVFSFPILAYGIYAEESAGQYKELGEMECYGLPDPNAGTPSTPAPLRIVSLGGQVGQCGELSGIGATSSFVTASPAQLDANSLATILRLDGTSSGTMTASVSLA